MLRDGINSSMLYNVDMVVSAYMWDQKRGMVGWEESRKRLDTYKRDIDAIFKNETEE